MTDAAPAPRRRRLPKHWVRAIAWVTGTATFVTGWGTLVASPRPSAAAPPRARTRRPVIIVRKITRRIVIKDPRPVAPVVSAPTWSGPAQVAAPPAPAPPPPTTTGGSHP